jgi:hypothetical protein
MGNSTRYSMNRKGNCLSLFETWMREEYLLYRKSKAEFSVVQPIA